VIILHHKLSSELTFEKFARRARLELDSESAAGKPASFAELVALDLNALAVLLPSLLVEILKSLLAAEFTIHTITIELTCEKFYQLRDTRDMDERASLEVSDFVERARRGGGGGGGVWFFFFVGWGGGGRRLLVVFFWVFFFFFF